MSYTVPPNNAVNFELEVYTLPANNAMNFDFDAGPPPTEVLASQLRQKFQMIFARVFSRVN